MLTTEERINLWKGILEATDDEAEWASIAKRILILDEQRDEQQSTTINTSNQNHNQNHFERTKDAN